jgi:hypothetical protein
MRPTEQIKEQDRIILQMEKEIKQLKAKLGTHIQKLGLRRYNQILNETSIIRNIYIEK